jgi:D-serine deaminase-like pyridoxal phosphate-dependent protein
MPWRIDDLDTPAVLIDLDRVEANLRRAQDYADAHRLRLRPHVKTHKIPEFARRQVELGAVGVTCQKLGEAEAMADGGIDDILLTFNLLGRAKAPRLVALARRVRLAVTLDNAVVAGELDAAMREAGLVLPVLVECDTGGERCGVQSPEEAVELARLVSA